MYVLSRKNTAKISYISNNFSISFPWAFHQPIKTVLPPPILHYPCQQRYSQLNSCCHSIQDFIHKFCKSPNDFIQNHFYTCVWFTPLEIWPQMCLFERQKAREGKWLESSLEWLNYRKAGNYAGDRQKNQCLAVSFIIFQITPSKFSNGRHLLCKNKQNIKYMSLFWSNHSFLWGKWGNF